MQNVIARDLAEKEINEWLDFKQIDAEEREEKKEAIAELVSAVEKGVFIVDKTTFAIKYKLKFPIGKDVIIKDLEFIPRITAGQLEASMNNVKMNDIYGTITAHISVLTGHPKNIIKALDTGDYKEAKKVAIFFM